MSGYGEKKFGPNDNLSRTQLIQILYSKEGKPAVVGSASFTDVQSGQWYTDAVNWAVSGNLISGYGDGSFGPNDNITREQLAMILWRYAGSPAATQQELSFADTDQISSYAMEALKWAYENGILSGKDNNRLDPQGAASRAQFAQMMMRLMENEQEK
jgi:hypothetical protein